MISNNFDLWSDAHNFYNKLDKYPKKDSTKEFKEDYFWRERMLNDTPNGHLLKNNSFFKSLDKEKFYFAHITFGLDDILKTESIYVSGGCLVGSIYGVPATKTQEGLTMHNLGEYIYGKEAYILAKKHYYGKKPNILVFEIENNSSLNPHLLGIDYLNLGYIHSSIYKDLEYLLSFNERFNLEEVVSKKIKQSLPLLELCSLIFHENHKVDPVDFIECYVRNIQNLPILGYLFFEAVSEYIMLFQDSAISKKYMERGEIYNAHYKKLMYDLEPGLKGNFKLSSFLPNFERLSSYIKSNKFISNFDDNNFAEYISRRLLTLVMSKLLSNTESIDWKKMNWDFSNLFERVSQLVGHLIHRELRNHGRYPSFYFYYDQTKALQIWNYWNHMDVSIPFNGIIPKGEVGINPAHPELNYKVYTTHVENTKGKINIELEKQINISLEPRLVSLRYTTMRNKSEQVNLKT